MDQCVVWIEGVDFAETLYDTDKISVVRGASRALETMPEAAHQHFEGKGMSPRPIVRGASIAAFLLKADPNTAQAALDGFRHILQTQGLDAQHTEKMCSKASQTGSAADIIKAAPFAHLKFQSALVPVTKGVDVALDQAKARVRVAQLKNPGSPIAANARLAPCDFDRIRASASHVTHGPDDEADSKAYHVSSASAARWHFGRMERHMIYLDAGVRKAFTNDLQTMVKAPPRDREMPLSARNKIAVFSADGDRFGSVVLPAVLQACESEEQGRIAFAGIVKERMNGLLSGLVQRLEALPPEASTVTDAKGVNRLRFETLLFGGEDVSFVVPSWLGWWLAQTFFELTRDWAITAEDIAKHGMCKPVAGFVTIPMSFSAGLLFANVKTPIRSLRVLADELCNNVKAANLDPTGGLDVEILESIEPPHGGIAYHRKRFVDDGIHSVIKLNDKRDIAQHYLDWKLFWSKANKPFPASQAHRMLHAALEKRRLTATSNTPFVNALEAYVTSSGVEHQRKLEQVGCLPAHPSSVFNMYRALQQRDYVLAAELALRGDAQ